MREYVWIVWEDYSAHEYCFNTPAEKEAFLLGVSETVGQTNFTEFDSDEECQAFLRREVDG